MPRVAVLGLGEAGRIYATDLAKNADVVGFDPAWSGEPDGFSVVPTAAEAVRESDIILVLTSGQIAMRVFDDVADSVPTDAIFADLSSSSPMQKLALSRRASDLGFRFADVTLLAPVPRARLSTPAQASGTGAADAAKILAPLGMKIEAVGEIAGQAAARKLLRSIVVKGMTALLIEGMRTAESLELGDWFSDHIDETLTHLDTAFLRRLIEGTSSHSERRVHEMLATVEMIKATGGRPIMVEATIRVLETVSEGIPRGERFR
jgi:3-hydroxyisobutyrate dehydrogenase-like beta-hydroxyacid dehydrogenase